MSKRNKGKKRRRWCKSHDMKPKETDHFKRVGEVKAEVDFRRAELTAVALCTSEGRKRLAKSDRLMERCR